MKKLQRTDIYPYVKGKDVVLYTPEGTVMKMSVKEFLALADEVRRKADENANNA